MLAGVLLVVLAQAPAAPVPPELTGVLDSRLTAPTPSATVTCTRATKADRLLLPDDSARARRVWSCTLQCVAPIGKRHALLIERHWRQPVLFLDDNGDGRFDARERHEFPRAGDLHVRVQLWTPERLTEREDELIKELAKVQKSVPVDRGKGFWSRMRDALGA